jgi:hypothetical protein
MKRRSLGKQQRAPAPYTKYDKKPHKYSPQYEQWKRRALAGRIVDQTNSAQAV